MKGSYAMLLFVNGRRNTAANVTAHVDSFALATFTLEYFDAAGALQPLGTSPLADTFTWAIAADLLAAPRNDALLLRLSFLPAVQQGGTNLWLSVEQGMGNSLHALNHPDPGNILPPYRACAAMNATNTHYEFAIAVV
jgi:hypothetical protein